MILISILLLTAVDNHISAFIQEGVNDTGAQNGVIIKNEKQIIQVKKNKKQTNKKATTIQKTSKQTKIQKNILLFLCVLGGQQGVRVCGRSAPDQNFILKHLFFNVELTNQRKWMVRAEEREDEVIINTAKWRKGCWWRRGWCWGRRV